MASGTPNQYRDRTTPERLWGVALVSAILAFAGLAAIAGLVLSGMLVAVLYLRPDLRGPYAYTIVAIPFCLNLLATLALLGIAG
jgi:hypothetical protein